MNRAVSKNFLLLPVLIYLTGCQSFKSSVDNQNELYTGPEQEESSWELKSEAHENLISLPKPKGRIIASAYGFRDQTGQYKPLPSNSFSTAVSQGANAILIKALRDSEWFIPIEREGLQNLLTERKIIRAGLKKTMRDIPPLLGASILIEGGIIGYDSNIKTGGAGLKYFGSGTSETYLVDQVTVSIRAVDIYTGKIINTVVISKSILSKEVSAGVFRFVKFKRLLEAEAGYTRNEPVQLALVDAVETAVIRLIVSGLKDNLWTLANPADIGNPVVQQYLDLPPTPNAQSTKSATKIAAVDDAKKGSEEEEDQDQKGFFSRTFGFLAFWKSDNKSQQKKIAKMPDQQGNDDAENNDGLSADELVTEPADNPEEDAELSQIDDTSQQNEKEKKTDKKSEKGLFSRTLGSLAFWKKDDSEDSKKKQEGHNDEDESQEKDEKKSAESEQQPDKVTSKEIPASSASTQGVAQKTAPAVSATSSMVAKIPASAMAEVVTQKTLAKTMATSGQAAKQMARKMDPSPIKPNKNVAAVAVSSSSMPNKPKPTSIMNDNVQTPLTNLYSVSSYSEDESSFYSIQLMSSKEVMDLVEFMADKEINRNDVRYISYELKGDDRFALLYGTYRDKDKAIRAIQTLPETLRVHQPWVRLVNEEL